MAADSEIHLLLKERGVTLEELSNRLGVTRSALYALEFNGVRPRSEKPFADGERARITIEKLAGAFNLSVEEMDARTELLQRRWLESRKTKTRPGIVDREEWRRRGIALVRSAAEAGLSQADIARSTKEAIWTVRGWFERGFRANGSDSGVGKTAYQIARATGLNEIRLVSDPAWTILEAFPDAVIEIGATHLQARAFRISGLQEQPSTGDPQVEIVSTGSQFAATCFAYEGTGSTPLLALNRALAKAAVAAAGKAP